MHNDTNTMINHGFVTNRISKKDCCGAQNEYDYANDSAKYCYLRVSAKISVQKNKRLDDYDLPTAIYHF